MSGTRPRRATRSDLDPSSARSRAGRRLALGLRAAYLTMHRRANAAFAKFGLTADQFVLLTVLAEGDGVMQKELTRCANSDPNTMSEMLGRLERRGLIVRERHAADGRALRVSLTEAGREAQRRAMEGTVALREALADLVHPDEVETLLGHLCRIAEGMSAADTPPARGARAAQPASRSAGTSPGARPETVD
jgi:MarR family transcriptional regulator, lower aerobic nicotinate degradation pathway regulator